MDSRVIEHLTLIAGVGDGEETACLSSAVSLADGRGLSDDHPSRVLRQVIIGLNDGPWWRGDQERTDVLMPMALSGTLCSSRVVVSTEVELARAYRCVRFAFGVLTSWMSALGMRTAEANRLRRLDPIVDMVAAYAAAGLAKEARAETKKEIADDADAILVLFENAARHAGYAEEVSHHSLTSGDHADSAARYSINVARRVNGPSIRDGLISLLSELADEGRIGGSRGPE